MPWSYCHNCEGEISDWQEEFLGCKHCGEGDIDSPCVYTNANVIKHLIEEIEELKRERKEEYLSNAHS